MGPVRRTRHLAVGWSCWMHRSHQLHALHLHFTAKCKGWRSGISGISGTWHLACHMPCFCNSLVFFTCHGVHGICYIWEHLGMLTFHSAWYLLYSLVLQPLILHGICYVLVVQTFMSVSLGIFRVSFRVSLGCQFRVSFSFFRVSLRFLSNVIRISFRVSLGCHLGYL